ncbi:glycosyltransferase family 4 protein [Fulvivirga sediminis]|uniref:Glycosyltransferase family 4 protein n=1 Tax=Fulvivirga sediminis TaxID=2803949 RepID=A0A937F8R3_9BACT|nr:glycosyltransferase family 4 protein [Fulvivirga sediminis]MBL3657256.1 glycosyltransferase family 4 protein [Fulvivirga sediminis]
MNSRCLWLTDNYPPQRGGMAQSCDRIVNGLRQAGVEIDIIHFTSKEGKSKKHQQQNGSYTSIPFSNSEAHVLNIAWNYIKKMPKFDFIVCFGGYISMTGAPVFSKWLDTRLVTLIRGNDLDAGIFTPRKRGILEDALRQSELVCTVSSDKADKISKWLSHPNAKFVANGIDMNEWLPTHSERQFAADWRAQNVSGDKTVLGIFGQLKAKKGLDFFLDSLKRTSWRDTAHLLLIGETEEHLIDLLESAELTYSILPFHDRYELMKYYLCCDAMVIPSFYDGMPNVLLEAGALGIPVLGSRVDGMADVITNHQDGFLFEPGNEDDCKKTLYQFFNLTRERQKELGANLKRTIETQYTIDHEIDNYKKHLL